MPPERTTPRSVSLLVFLIPCLFLGLGLLVHHFETSAKGLSFAFWLMALYTGAFAAVYALWRFAFWGWARFRKGRR